MDPTAQPVNPSVSPVNNPVTPPAPLPPVQPVVSPVQQPVPPPQPPTPPPPPSPTQPPPPPQSAPPQTLEPPLPVPPPANPIQKQGSFNLLNSLWAKILIGIIILIVFGGAAFVLSSQNSKSPTTLAQPTPGPGCHYQEVTCIKAPCPQILICNTPTSAPTALPTIIASASAVTPTPSLKLYTNTNGYSINYPSDFTIASDSAFTFEIQSPDLTMTFISDTATDTAKTTLLKRPTFCPLNVKDVDATVSGKITYQRNGTFANNTTCLNTLIPNITKVYEIRGKPTNTNGVDLFSQILQTFKLNP